MAKKESDGPKVIDNLEIHGDHVVVSVNPKIYALDVVYSAGYVLMDRAYVVIDGDPETEILVELRPRGEKEDAETVGRDFNNELLNYAVYKSQSERNKDIRETIVKRALFTNSDECGCLPESDAEDTSYLDDPEGIAIPWEEKYGKKDGGNTD